jgi:hypothetical protein
MKRLRILIQDAGTYVEGAVLGDVLESAHQVEAQGVATSAPPHIFLFFVGGFAQVDHELLHQVPAKFE